MSTDFNSEHFATRRFLVTGKVQGVWFRATTQKACSELGLNGYAKNLPGGQVEVVLQGNLAAITHVAHWLTKGPAGAEVRSVIEVDAENSILFNDFKRL